MESSIEPTHSFRWGKVRAGAIEFLLKNNTRYFLTLTFPGGAKFARTRALQDRFILHLNRKIYRSAFSKRGVCLRGYSVKELTPDLETNHFHLMIRDDPGLPDYHRMAFLIGAQMAYLQGARKRSCIATFYLLEYYNYGQNDLERYVTKQFEPWSGVSFERATDSIGIITSKGVEYGPDVFHSPY